MVLILLLQRTLSFEKLYWTSTFPWTYPTIRRTFSCTQPAISGRYLSWWSYWSSLILKRNLLWIKIMLYWTPTLPLSCCPSHRTRIVLLLDTIFVWNDSRCLCTRCLVWASWPLDFNWTFETSIIWICGISLWSSWWSSLLYFIKSFLQCIRNIWSFRVGVDLLLLLLFHIYIKKIVWSFLIRRPSENIFDISVILRGVLFHLFLFHLSDFYADNTERI